MPNLEHDQVPLTVTPGQSTISRPLRTGRSFVLVVEQVRVLLLHWDRASADPGEVCNLVVVGANLGSSPAELQIEMDGGGGVWVPVETLRATVSADGREAHARWIVPGAASADPSLTGCFDDTELQVGETAWISARTSDPDGVQLQFFLEREADQGWVVVGQAVSTVRDRTARAGIAL